MKLLRNFECFYPCFNGIRVLARKDVDHGAIRDGVSILVLMESGFLPMTLSVDKAADIRFLSLF